MKQEPVAWMVYTLDGKSVCVTDNPADFTPDHRALPLYTSPPPVGEDWEGIAADQAMSLALLRSELAAAQAQNQECNLLLSRVLHELAGSASLCWEPKPTGVFATELALGFVEDAIKELRAALAGEKK